MKAWGVFIVFLISLIISLIPIPLSVMAATTMCSSCTTCNDELNDPTKAEGDVIMVSNIADMTDFDVDGNCIVHDSGTNKLIFDCSGKIIAGSGTGSGITSVKRFTIINCTVSNFQNGIFLDYGSGGSTITDSELSGNVWGVFVNSWSNKINDTVIISNNQGIYIAHEGNRVYNNRFDNNQDNFVIGEAAGTNYWSVQKVLGTNIIGGPYIGGNYWSDYAPTADNNDDGLDDNAYLLAAGNEDTLPLVYDTFPPLIPYAEPPTPGEGETVYSDTIIVKITANEVLTHCIFDWDGTNHTVYTTDENCSRDFTVTTAGLYHYRVYAVDTDSNMNITYGDENVYREVTFNLDSLVLNFINPTPQDNNYSADDSYTIIASPGDGSTLTSCILEWNGVNESVDPISPGYGSSCPKTKPSLPDGSYTFRMYATDENGRNASTPTRTATVDTILDLAYDPETPVNNSVRGEGWAYIKVNSDIPLQGCNLTLNGMEEVMSVSGTSCYINKTGLEDLTYYTFNVSVTDIIDKENTTENITFRIDTTGPVISVHTVTPTHVTVGDNITINMSATDGDGIDELWVIVTKPDDTTERVGMVNEEAVNYTIISAGSYTITFYANDTVGSSSSVSHTITSNQIIQFSSAIEFGNETSSASLELYLTGTTTLIDSYISSTGVFSSNEVVDGIYDIYLTTFNDTLLLKLNGVNISADNSKTIKLDYITPAAEGFAYTYAVENPYIISSALMRIYYNEDDDVFVSERGLELFRCAQWNFTTRNCTGSWSKISYTLSISGDYIEAEVDDFSGFSVKQGSYCGDGICSSEETPTSCSSDCVCVPGDTRSCMVAHFGICAEGTETCTEDMVWSGCQGPGTEECNSLDDDCDGIIDNIDGKTSILSTKCGCYGGNYATIEICDGIDNDCDGKIDDGSDCCTPGDIKECGTSLTLGTCQPGTSTCVNGIWGECMNAVTPIAEICDNYLDDDCDGVTDDGCMNYSVCAEGEISAGCICGGEITEYGYCCNGDIYIDGCPASSGWWVLVAIGVVVLIILYIIMTYFKSRGSELTWETLTGKYRTPEKGAEPGYGGKLSSEKEMERFESGKQNIKEQPNVFDELKKKNKKK